MEMGESSRLGHTPEPSAPSGQHSAPGSQEASGLHRPDQRPSQGLPTQAPVGM